MAKLFLVNVDCELYVVAEDEDAAVEFVEDDIFLSDTLEGANVSAYEFEAHHKILSSRKETIPFNSDNDDTVQQWVDRLRKKAREKAEFDSHPVLLEV